MNPLYMQYAPEVKEELDSLGLGGMEMTLNQMSPLSEGSIGGSPYNSIGIDNISSNSAPQHFYSLSIPQPANLTNSFGSYGQSPVSSSVTSQVSQAEDEGTQRHSVSDINERRRKRRESHNAV